MCDKIVLLFYFCNRFLGCNLKVIPVHSTADAVKGMLVIATVSCDAFLQFSVVKFISMVHAKHLMAFLFQATSKPNVVNLGDQMSLACTHIIDHSPVWEMLQE